LTPALAAAIFGVMGISAGSKRRESRKRAKPISLKGLVVYAVDDESEQVEIIRKALEKEECQVVGTDDPQAMANLLKTNRADLIIADIVMPKIDGWELFRQIRQEPINKNTPVVFLTALAANNEEGLFTQGLGRCRVLAKPISPRRLVADIKEFLGVL
jgi:CheY-like chemotaxis protein